MAVINSSEVYLNISTDGGKTFNLVAHSDQADFNSGMSVRDVSTKFDGGQRVLESAKREWGLSTSGLVVYLAEGLTPVDLFDYIDTRKLLYVEMSGANESQSFYVIGQAYMDAKQVEGSNEDNQAYSVGFQGTRFSGSSWGKFAKERAIYKGGTAEAVPCVDAQVMYLRALIIN